MGKVKYSEEMKLQTVKYVLEGGKSATKVSKELGINANTVCRWVREYREAQGMPSYEAEQRIKRQSADEMAHKIKELEKELKRKERELADEKEKVEILKNPCEARFASHHLCNHKNEMRSDLCKSSTVFGEKPVYTYYSKMEDFKKVDTWITGPKNRVEDMISLLGQPHFTQTEEKVYPGSSLGRLETHIYVFDNGVVMVVCAAPGYPYIGDAPMLDLAEAMDMLSWRLRY